MGNFSFEIHWNQQQTASNVPEATKFNVKVRKFGHPHPFFSQNQADLIIR